MTLRFSIRMPSTIGIDSPDVTDLKHCLKYFCDKSRIPENRLDNISRFHSSICKVIQGKAKPRSAALVFRDWQVEERLGGTDHYSEYRAKHSRMGKSGGIVRLRVYNADPYLSPEDRKKEYLRISNAFRAVTNLPSHETILKAREFIENEEQDQFVLVTDDIAGQPLRLHLKKSSMALTFDQKLLVMRDVLSALDHAHRHEVIHRNLTPDVVLVVVGGHARITGFDFARVGKNRSSTIADQIVDDLEAAYQAPECFKDPTKASIASDLYSAGLVFYELLTGELPFENIDQMMEADGKFPIKPSEHKPDLPQGIDEWLQKFCEFDPEDRHISAAVAHKALDDLILPEGKNDPVPALVGSIAGENVPQVPEDMTKLPQDFILADRFRIQKKLGSGGFGVAYKVFDSLGDVVRVIKLVTKDRRSVYERLRREYKTLTNLPEHPHVVKVIWADRMTDANQTPYIVFEYVEGLDVSDLIDTGALSLEDSIRIVRETAEGLRHLHKNGVYHQDVKPSNLLWTDKGVRIIDFNVAVVHSDDDPGGGGTRRYMPPDYDYSSEPDAPDRIDRDLYGLGITFYESLTGKYPFDEPTPPINTQPKNPRQFTGCVDLSNALVNVLIRMISPQRKDRFTSAEEFLKALVDVKHFRSVLTTGEIGAGTKVIAKLGFEPSKPNTNPFVKHLLTLYSQSQVSNAGTRGLDEIGKATYVQTYLDEKLKPALLKGEFSLVVISGNAGDGKTAFIQQFEVFAESKGAQMQRGVNGAVFNLKGHTYQSNYDGSQDEGDDRNDAVLQKFFGPFAGKDKSTWPENQTRLIAINEGRLVDFFLENEDKFPLLTNQIQQGLAGAAPEIGIAVLNLNLRSVVAESGESKSSILERLISTMTKREYWQACEKCDLKVKCYAYHNAMTFQDPVAGPKVIERLKMIYTITHLRGRLHITMRDLRSGLAFMLAGTRDCDEIHNLYQNGGEESQNRILDSFYFNSWLGGGESSNDRIISLLSEIDMAKVSNPRLDLELGFLSPGIKAMSRFSFAGRSRYDDELVEVLFHQLPRDYSSKNRSRLIAKHRRYLSHMRRRYFFERRDGDWQEMLPYGSAEHFLSSIRTPGVKSAEDIALILRAINHGEGLSNPGRLGELLALRVRQVDKGTIRSYRLFEGKKFTLRTEQDADSNPFLECLSQALILSYDSGDGHKAKLRINLDIYEMLMRLNRSS